MDKIEIEKNLENDLKEILNKYEFKDYESLKTYINSFSFEEKRNKLIKDVEKNKYLVGKCFIHKVDNPLSREMYRYTKVISNRSKNRYTVECLEFDEHPLYWYEYNSSVVQHPENYYLGHFDLDTIKTNSVFIKDFEKYDYIEITLEEYNTAMRKHIEELINLKWYEDHCRFGGKLPIDDDWFTQ